MKKIGVVNPYLFEDFLLISIKKEWLNVWEKIPNFLVFVGKDSQLIIKSCQPDDTKSGGVVSEQDERKD